MGGARSWWTPIPPGLPRLRPPFVVSQQNLPFSLTSKQAPPNLGGTQRSACGLKYDRESRTHWSDQPNEKSASNRSNAALMLALCLVASTGLCVSVAAFESRKELGNLAGWRAHSIGNRIPPLPGLLRFDGPGDLFPGSRSVRASRFPGRQKRLAKGAIHLANR